jgi:hypothetical protein
MNTSKKLTTILLFALSCFLCLQTYLYGEEASQTGAGWQASWIGVADVQKQDLLKDVNQWTCFRKTVHLDQVPRQAVARIAVDSKYWLWINGGLVVLEGELKRGPTPEDTYYDQVDLTAHLREGENTIAVLEGFRAERIR